MSIIARVDCIFPFRVWQCFINSTKRCRHTGLRPPALYQLTSETWKSDTTGSRMSSVRTLTQYFNTPPQREILAYHPHTTALPRVKARAAKDEERKEKIRLALEDRTQFNTSFGDLHHKYGIPKSTLCDRARGMQSRQKAHEDYQALPPAMEDVLKKWALRMDSQGFPPRLDIFKAVAKKLFQQQLDNSNDSEPKNLGPTWQEAF